jgi:phospholipid/cholesterol/gamma-HCH transport system substrate-binding protein
VTTQAKAHRLSSVQLGAVVLVAGLGVGYCLFHKAQLVTALRPGDTVKIDFDRAYRLKIYTSKVKLAGVPVGVVTGVHREAGGVQYQIKINKDIRSKLGAAPSAAIRPTTLLGGNYYLEIKPGGDPGTFVGVIPATRTTVPVELDTVLNYVGPEQRKGLQTLITQLDKSVGPTGSTAAKSLVASSPSTLGPAATVLDALRGTHQDTDLSDIVSGLSSTARVLTAQKQELDALLTDAAGTAVTLANRRDDLATTLRDAPATLANTRAGLQALNQTLGLVRTTAPRARASVQSATVLLAASRPVLAQARVLLTDLRPMAADLRPLLQGLMPLVPATTALVSDVNGAPLRRIQGPVLSTVLAPYRGSTRFYQELAYMFAGLDATSAMVDRNGATIGFDPGVGVQSIGGLPLADPLVGTTAPSKGVSK